MADIETLRAVLEFRRDVNAQVPIVTTLLAGVAIAGATAVLSNAERSRLRTTLLVAFAGASLLFVFTTVLSSVLAAPLHAAGGRSAGHMQGLDLLARLAVYAALVGILVLTGAIGGIGYLYSRRAGRCVLGLAIAMFALFAGCLVYLNAVMSR